MGGPGLGKSHLLAALIGDAVEAGFGAGYMAWPDLITRHRDAQQAGRDHPDRSLLQTAMEADVLALDEIGLAPATEWQMGELFRLIDHRYANLRPTLLAGNVNPATLERAIGERTADRLRECCVCAPLTGASRRADAPQRPEPPRLTEPLPLTLRAWRGHRWADRHIGPQPTGRREL
jgi:DNA replication protein DnaC